MPQQDDWIDARGAVGGNPAAKERGEDKDRDRGKQGERVGRSHLLRQLQTESLLLSLLGGVCLSHEPPYKSCAALIPGISPGSKV